MDDRMSDPRGAFARELTANHSRLRAFVYSLVQDHHSADDVMQDVASVLWKKYSEGEHIQNFRSWAITIARFTVLNWRRRQARLPIPMDDEQFAILADAAIQAVERNDPRSDALMDCFQKLDQKQQA
ncbi:MAG: sigma-70 family RNA polymerase sigma factor, partial [Verrucomicrobiota bacterium]